MRHLILLLAVLLVSYAGWRLASKKERKQFTKFVGAHLPWVALILIAVIGALVAMFYGGSINLL